MRDLLVRYLLGELDDDEQQRLEEQLRGSPELQRELAYLQACFSPADIGQKEATEPPDGLAQRTANRIAGLVCGAQEPGADPFSPSPAAGDPSPDPASAAPKWSFADLSVAAGVCLAVTMLLLPALRESRDSARRRDCSNNLRQVGTLLANYEAQHSGFYPRVSPYENTGMFAVRLVDEGYIRASDLAQLLVCRSSPLADDVRAGRVVVQIPNGAELQIIHGPKLFALRQLMGGSYAYRMGYFDKEDGNRYYHVHNDGQGRSPLLADAPSFQLASMQSANHRGCGQNVLFQDMSVRYLTNCTVPGRKDHMFLNDDGMHAAGRGPQDVVLGRSEVAPGSFAIRFTP